MEQVVRQRLAKLKFSELAFDQRIPSEDFVHDRCGFERVALRRSSPGIMPEIHITLCALANPAMR
jgi:hypothetical protein